MTPADIPSTFDTNTAKAICAAANNANRVSADWALRAEAYVRSAADSGKQFRIQDVAKLAHKDGLPKPPTARAWGAIAARLSKLGVIRHIRYEYRDADGGSHPCPVTVWAGSNQSSTGLTAVPT